MSTSQSPSLTVLESLCFEQVSFWVGVVTRNGGKSGRLVNGAPFTRLPAGDLVDNLTERLPLVSLTVRQVRRALNRLVELGLVVREQFWQWRGCSDYWYSLPDVVAGGCTQSSESVPPVPVSVTPPSPSVTPPLPAGSHPCDQNGHPFLKPLSSPPSEQTRQTDEDSEPNPQPATSSRGTDRLPLTPAATPLQLPVQTVTDPLPPVPTAPSLHGHTVPSGVASRGTVWERVRALAARFDPAAVSSVSPSAVVLNGRVHRVNDGACAPLR